MPHSLDMDKAKHGGKPPRSNSAHQEKLSGKKRPRSDAGGESKSHHGGGGGKPKHGDGNKDWKMKPGKKITKEDLEVRALAGRVPEAVEAVCSIATSFFLNLAFPRTAANQAEESTVTPTPRYHLDHGAVLE